MKQLPLDIGIIHFVGIGGIGMSGIAEVMHSLGYKVQGSDLADSANVVRLRALGITISKGHAEANLGEARVVVVSTAVKADNPEVVAARHAFIPVVRRAEMLAELMRFKWSVAVGGTHGKTTTTSLIAAMLDAASFDPTVINGGIINAYNTNARLGTGEWMVVEADESDGTFVKLPATVAVVTNIDPEHLDFYGDFDTARRAYQTFVENIPFYGFAALCVDHPEVQALCGRISDRKIITYGLSPLADVRAERIVFSDLGTTFDVAINDRVRGTQRVIKGVRLNMPGAHNVQNALSAFVVANEMGIADDIARGALKDFRGVKRRFTIVGTGGGVTVVDDYAHHPVEIAAVLKAARDMGRDRVITVVQPHRYSRLRDLFDDFCTCFNNADTVIVADVYPAGETPIEGYDRDTLIEGLRRHGHRHAVALSDEAALADVVAEHARAGDLVICMGAGNVTAWAQRLPAELSARLPEPGLREVGT
ncbi:MAG: UDP-N-acetylmuramate--L-alanine ligase [Proteobacteria bacterium]|nr:UDP-N-acetylmuramate--L-alanine ligase [Pseudomonadota bacterium]MDA1057627.1 UDP-N-acetylmuramate--L-alanine ligase [Pseudomonadota bacterium]